MIGNRDNAARATFGGNVFALPCSAALGPSAVGSGDAWAILPFLSDSRTSSRVTTTRSDRIGCLLGKLDRNHDAENDLSVRPESDYPCGRSPRSSRSINRRASSFVIRRSDGTPASTRIAAWSNPRSRATACNLRSCAGVIRSTIIPSLAPRPRRRGVRQLHMTSNPSPHRESAPVRRDRPPNSRIRQSHSAAR